MINSINGYTKVVGIIANPIKHSISPTMHNTSFEHNGLNYVYVAFEVEKENLKDAIAGCRALGVVGFNVSMPYKIDVIKYLDGLDKSARLSKAVNTVVLTDNKYIGYNSDGAGFMMSLKDNNIDVIGKKVAILGSGGAALAIIAQGAIDGIAKIVIYKRNIEDTNFIEKINDIINETNCEIIIKDINDKTSLKQDIHTSVLLVNTTSVGMHPNVDDCLIDDMTVFHNKLSVVDIIYNPKETVLLKMAREAGCKTCNGKPMLLFQGAVAFNYWTGQDMPIDKIKKIMEI